LALIKKGEIKMREVDYFAIAIKEGIEKLFPSSRINVKVDGGSLGKGHIFISFTLWTKYPNNIHQNDPAHTTMWIWNSHFEDGTLREDMKLEMSQGNRLWGYNASTLEERIGFRGVKSGNDKKVLKAIINYFKKLKMATETHKEELQSSWGRYVSTGSIKVASGRRPNRRSASEIIRNLELRIARLEKESSSPVFELEGHIHEGSEGDYYVRKRGGIKEITSYIESWSNRVLIAEEGNWEIKYDYKHFFGFTASNGLTELELFCVEGECRSEVRQLELLLRKVLLIPRSVRTDFNK